MAGKRAKKKRKMRKSGPGPAQTGLLREEAKAFEGAEKGTDGAGPVQEIRKEEKSSPSERHSVDFLEKDTVFSSFLGRLKGRICSSLAKIKSALRKLSEGLFHVLLSLIRIVRSVFSSVFRVFSGFFGYLSRPLCAVFGPPLSALDRRLQLFFRDGRQIFHALLERLKALLMKKGEKKDLPALDPQEERRLKRVREERIAALSPGTDPGRGLSEEEVQERVSLGLSNVQVEGASITFRDIVRENVFTYFNLIFAIITLLLILVGSFQDLAYVVVVVANTAIGITQEWISKKTLDKISILNAPNAQVLRDGKKAECPVSDLVRDDVVFLSAGEQIPADAVILEGEISVNEALLTGEQSEVKKGPGDQILSGSFVVSGSSRCRLTFVGEQSFSSKLTLEARKLRHEENSEMIRSLNILVRATGIAIIPIGLLLFWKMFFVNGMPLRDGVSSTVAAVIGMIPEGLYLLASVTMATSVARLALNQVLVHDMRSIEALARVDVLCVDKTGTITENKISIAGISVLDEDSNDDVRIRTLISDFVASQSIDNATMKAMRACFRNPSGRRADLRIPFSPERRYSAAVFGSKTLILGAPETVLGSGIDSCRRRIEELTLSGKRVMAFGVLEKALEKGQLLDETEKIRPLCLVIAENPVRRNARKTFAFFEEQKVQVKVISGDSPLTASRVALDAGIRDADLCVDASTLLTKEELYESVDRYTVFGRVSPEQKRELISAFQKRGLKVAMTGDGVNDVLAMKDADCSIAMASGSQAAAHAAQMVLLDSDFARMPSVLSEGRRVVNNVQRTATLFLVKNIFSLLMSLFSIIFGYNYPLRPTQIALVSCFTIGVPAFLLSFEPNRRKISGNFMRNVLFRAFPAGITDFLMICGISFFADLFEIETGDLPTACAILLLVVGLMILSRVMAPMTRMHWVIELGMLLCFTLSALIMPDLFQLTPLSGKVAFLTLLFAATAEPCLRYLSLLFDYLNGLLHALWRKLKESDYLMQI